MAFPAPRRAGERERERERERSGPAVSEVCPAAAGLRLQLRKKEMDGFMPLAVPTGPWLSAWLLIDPLVAGRQDYNSKKTTGRGRLHSYIQGATTRGPFLAVLFFSSSCSLAYHQSIPLKSLQGNACVFRLVFAISE